MPADATPQQESSKNCCYVKLHIKGRDGLWMHAMALVDTGTQTAIVHVLSTCAVCS